MLKSFESLSPRSICDLLHLILDISLDIQTSQCILNYVGSTSIIKLTSRACEFLCVSSSGNYDNVPAKDIQKTD